MNTTVSGAFLQDPFADIHRQVKTRALQVAAEEAAAARKITPSNCLPHFKDGQSWKPECSWLDSKARRMLRAGKSHSGVWIPAWTGHVTTDAAERRLLASILFWFDDRGTRNPEVKRNRVPVAETTEEVFQMDVDRLRRRKMEFYAQHRPTHRCRARAMRDVCFEELDKVTGLQYTDGIRTRCLEQPLRVLAGAAGLSEKVGRRCLRNLETRNAVIVAREQKPDQSPVWAYCEHAAGPQKGILLFPNGYGLARALVSYGGGDPESVPTTISLLGNWYESEYRKLGMNRDGRRYAFPNEYAATAAAFFAPILLRHAVSRGTFVDDWIYAACEERPGPAHVMAQLLWFCDANRRRVATEDESKWEIEEVPRARVLREGRRWTLRSNRHLAKYLDYPEADIRDWTEWLVEEQHFFTRKQWPWRGWANSVNHYSPNPETIGRALKRSRQRAESLRRLRFPEKVGPNGEKPL